MPKPTALETAVAEFTAAMVANDDAAGIKAVGAIAVHAFGTLERIAAALEALVALKSE